MSNKNLSVKKANSSNYFNTEIFLLKVCGISLEENESFAYRIYSVIILLISFLYPLVAFQGIFKYGFSVSSHEIAIVGATFMTVVIAGPSYLNRKKLGNLLQTIQQQPFVATKKRGYKEESKLIMDWIAFKNKQLFLFLTFVGIAITYPVIYTLFNRIKSSNSNDWTLAFGRLTFLNATYSPNYEICWFYQNIVITVHGISACVLTSLLAGILTFISTHFKILQNHLRKMTEKASYGIIKEDVNVSQVMDSDTISRKYLNAHVKKIVMYHLNITRIAKELEEIFSNIILFVYLCSLSLLAVELYGISLIPMTEIRMLVVLLIETLAGSFYSLVICYSGHAMATESLEVANAAYDCNFVGLDLAFQKSLIIIIRRSQIPVIMKAGKTIEASMITYVWILRTAYSTFMVLRNVINKY